MAAVKKSATRKKATAKRSTAKRSTVKRAATSKTNEIVSSVDAADKQMPKNPCRLVSVFGPFNSHVLVQMPAEFARAMFEDIGQPDSRSAVIRSVEHELRAIEDRILESGDGAKFREDYAATAIEMALQLEHPYNSATSKSMCAKVLNDTMDKLHELAPAAAQADGVDEVQQRREQRRAAIGA